jgi:serine O-acetyltransferase
MKLSIKKSELCHYISTQIDNFYPDKYAIKNDVEKALDIGISRLEFCFKHVAFNRYNFNGETLYNHLYADHHVMLLWFLANVVWQELNNENLASKLYYLNKTLHGVDCMYNTPMPNIFLIFHGVGTMLGKAHYDDYFVVLQGCTVGSHKGFYPKFGKGVSLTANSSVIGKCDIGDRATISTRTTLFQKNIPNDSVAFMNFDKGILEVKSSRGICYAQQFFNIDLKTL